MTVNCLDNLLEEIVLEMEQEKKRDVTVEDISFYGTGGTDIDGEWQWSGDYQMELSRRHKNTNYNFYATVSRRRSRKNWKTIGWTITLYLSMFYSNGRDIKVLDNKKVKSLKSAKQVILEKIQEIHSDVQGTQKLLNDWKDKNAKPVFVLDNETGTPILIGTSYISASVEMDKSREDLWFNEDIPNYNNYRTFYELQVSWHKPVHFYAYKTEKSWGGYTGSSEKDESLVKQMVDLIRDNQKYAWLFEQFDRYRARYIED